MQEINPEECNEVTIDLYDLQRILRKLSSKIMEAQLTIGYKGPAEEIYFLIKELLDFLEPINKKSNL